MRIGASLRATAHSVLFRRLAMLEHPRTTEVSDTTEVDPPLDMFDDEEASTTPQSVPPALLASLRAED